MVAKGGEVTLYVSQVDQNCYVASVTAVQWTAESIGVELPDRDAVKWSDQAECTLLAEVYKDLKVDCGLCGLVEVLRCLRLSLVWLTRNSNLDDHDLKENWRKTVIGFDAQRGYP
jgi:hypothetical protein